MTTDSLFKLEALVIVFVRMRDHVSSTEPFPLFDVARVGQLEHPRTRHVVVRLFHRVHDVPHLERAHLEDRVGFDEELLKLFRGEMAIRTSVRFLWPGRRTREDLLTATKWPKTMVRFLPP